MISGNVFHWYVKFYHKKRSVSSSELTDLFLFVRELFHSPFFYPILGNVFYLVFIEKEEERFP